MPEPLLPACAGPLASPSRGSETPRSAPCLVNDAQSNDRGVPFDAPVALPVRSAAHAAAPDAATDKPTSAALAVKRFDATTDGDRPQAQTSSAFNRGGDPFPGLSPEGTTSVVDFAFSGKEGDVMAEPVRTTDGFVVVELKQHKVATPEEFQKDRDAFEEGLLRAKRDEALSLYVKRLREQAKADVKVDESYVQEARADGGAGSATEDEDEY